MVAKATFKDQYVVGEGFVLEQPFFLVAEGKFFGSGICFSNHLLRLIQQPFFWLLKDPISDQLVVANDFGC